MLNAFFRKYWLHILLWFTIAALAWWIRRHRRIASAAARRLDERIASLHGRE